MFYFRLFRKYLRQTIFISLGVCLLLYFAFHLLQGERGLLSYFQAQERLELAEGTLESLEAERQALEAKVTLLQDQTLDLDLLDQRARELLNMSLPGEKIIFVR